MLGSLNPGTTQVTGLASGLNTNQIITAEMAIYQQPVTNLQNQQSGLNATNKALTSIQSQLQTLAADAQALADPSLFATSQTVTTNDPTRVTASTATGAGVGSYQVSVTALATSAQRGFTYTSPTSADSIMIDNQQVSIPAGQSISDFVNSINSNTSLDVYAAATNSGTVVFSNRATGNTGTNYVSVTNNNNGTLTANGFAKQGQNAAYSVDGTNGTSPTNTVTGAIAGVTLNLNGLTTTTGPITVNVGSPQPNATNIQNAVNAFVTQYNSVISGIQTQLAQVPSSSDPTKGTLYGDPALSGLLSSMRAAMLKAGSGLPAGLATMLDIGVSTGATTGTGAVSQSSLAGDLTLNASTLTSQLTANPNGVHSVLNSWSINFSALVNGQGAPGGSIDQRIQGDSSQVAQLGNQITAMQSALTDKQNALVQQFAQLESALSTNQSMSAWLTSQLPTIPLA